MYKHCFKIHPENLYKWRWLILKCFFLTFFFILLAGGTIKTILQSSMSKTWSHQDNCSLQEEAGVWMMKPLLTMRTLLIRWLLATSNFQTKLLFFFRFLKHHFNVVPTVGWQIDAFGHSSTMMAFSNLMGFNAVFSPRIDY